MGKMGQQIWMGHGSVRAMIKLIKFQE